MNRSLIDETIKWLQELTDPFLVSFLVSPEVYQFFCPPLPKKPELSVPVQPLVERAAPRPSPPKISPPAEPVKSHTPQSSDDIKKLIERAAPHMKLKEKPSGVALVCFTQEEEQFYRKLQLAIEQHLMPATVIEATQWEDAKQRWNVKWILATRDLPGDQHIPRILLSSPETYQNDLEAKKQLWKRLCQTLALPQSS